MLAPDIAGAVEDGGAAGVVINIALSLIAKATRGHDAASQFMTAGFTGIDDSTVAATYARRLLEFAVAKGADPLALFQRSRIDPAQLAQPENRIPLSKYIDLIQAAKDLCRDPALALHFGEEVEMTEMSIVPFIGSSAMTLGDILAQLNRYGPLDIDLAGVSADRFRLSRIDGQLWFVDDRPNPNDFPEITESAFARMICTMRRSSSRTQLLLAIHMTHPAPPYRDEYDRIFQVPVLFDRSENGLLLNEKVLPKLMHPHVSSEYASGILGAHADALLQKLESSKTIRGQVEDLLKPILHTREATVVTIAGRLGMSRQTLFRKLKAEEVTFEKVLDDLRHRVALLYLNEKKLSVNETAYRVGFSDPAVFSRAFKRWTGHSPRRARGHGERRS